MYIFQEPPVAVDGVYYQFNGREADMEEAGSRANKQMNVLESKSLQPVVGG